MSNSTDMVDADPRVRRHAVNKARILEEAWKLAGRDGVAGISLGDLAKAVGLRQPSLYTYFRSKSDLYDAMFAEGNRRLLAEVTERKYPEDPREAVLVFAKTMVTFCAADTARYHLLFQRHIPTFEPSRESYDLAELFYDWYRALLKRAGIRRDADLAVLTALIGGLADQQVANDPGGDRWIRLADDVADMFLERLEQKGGFGR